jgi:hypothetical protein
VDRGFPVVSHASREYDDVSVKGDTLRFQIGAVTLLLVLGGTLFAAQRRFGMRHSEQYEPEMQDPVFEDPPDARERTEWAFARLRYRGPGQRVFSRWGTDSNKAERIFAQGVRRLTRIHTRSVEEVIDADSDEIVNWPWIWWAAGISANLKPNGCANISIAAAS